MTKLLIAKIMLVVIYEIVIFCLLIAAIMPEGVTFVVFWGDPFNYMRIDQYSIGLTLALFVPLFVGNIKKLKLFGAEVELSEDIRNIRKEVTDVKKGLVDQRYQFESALFTVITRMNRKLTAEPDALQNVRDDDDIRIGCLDFAESWIVSQIVYKHLRSQGIEVTEPLTGETTLLTYLNLFAGSIDLFVWYSGTAMAMTGQGIIAHDADGGRALMNRLFEPWGFNWLPSLGFENQEGPVMLRDRAEKLNIKSLSDLARKSHRLTFGANREFFLRNWSYPRLKRTGLNFLDVVETDINDRIRGLFEGRFDVGIGYWTDPELDGHTLVFLDNDDRFPAIRQFAMPLANRKTADRIAAPLESLTIGLLQMQRMLSDAGRDGYSPNAIRGVVDNFRNGKYDQ
jgi:osmoprotectant transport system substrate-binding protein